MKALELYKTLSRLEKQIFYDWLGNRNKNFASEKNGFRVLIEIMDTYIQACTELEGKVALIWEEWLAKNPKVVVAIKKLKNDATELHREIEKFLLNERKKDDSKIFRLIDLYYIYRERGIKERQSEIIKELVRYINRSNELYLHYLYKQLEVEDYNLNHRAKNDEIEAELIKSFHVNWITEYIFLACHKEEKILLLDVFFEKMPKVKEHNLVAFYLKLHAFYLGAVKELDEKSIGNVFSELIKHFPKIPPYRQKDCFFFFLRKVMQWFGTERTYTRLKVFMYYMDKGIDEKNAWLYVGKYLNFKDYSNYVLQFFMLYEGKKTEMQNHLKKIEKNIKKDVDFWGGKEEELLELRISYYWGEIENYKSIYNIDIRKFPDISHKLQLIILQFKAGFFLMQSSKQLKTYQFWRDTNNALTHYRSLFPENTKGIRWELVKKEWELWENIYIVSQKTEGTEYNAAKEMLQTWCQRYENTDFIFYDKSLYITLINQCRIK